MVRVANSHFPSVEISCIYLSVKPWVSSSYTASPLLLWLLPCTAWRRASPRLVGPPLTLSRSLFRQKREDEEAHTGNCSSRGAATRTPIPPENDPPPSSPFLPCPSPGAIYVSTVFVKLIYPSYTLHIIAIFRSYYS